MDQLPRNERPYALKAGDGWTYRFGIDFTVKSSEVEAGSGAAFMEYVTKKGEEPPGHTHETENEMSAGGCYHSMWRRVVDLEKGLYLLTAVDAITNPKKSRSGLRLHNR
jgi:hypothetical protein